MSSNLDSVSVGDPPLDVGLGDVLNSVRASVWRRKVLVGGITASAIGLGVLAVFIIPLSYTSTAFVRGGFVVSTAVAKDEDSKGGPYVGLDLTRMIETQSSLLHSEELARRVVQQIGLERLEPELSKSHWLPVKSSESSTETEGKRDSSDPIDQAAMTLLSRLSVTSDQLRTYMIEISYTGKDPALAVAVTNAFVAEFLRSSKLQVLSRQRSSAEAAVLIELDKFGEKHPRVMQARVRLDNADAQLKEQLNQPPAALLQAAGENVTLASANTLTSRPRPRLVIGLLTLVGLVLGVAFALYNEKRRWAETFSRYVS